MHRLCNLSTRWFHFNRDLWLRSTSSVYVHQRHLKAVDGIIKIIKTWNRQRCAHFTNRTQRIKLNLKIKCYHQLYWITEYVWTISEL